MVSVSNPKPVAEARLQPSNPKPDTERRVPGTKIPVSRVIKRLYCCILASLTALLLPELSPDRASPSAQERNFN